MTTTTSEQRTPKPLAEAIDLCRDKVGPPSEAELEQGLDSFLARIHPSKSRPRRMIRWSLVGASLAICAVLVVKLAPILSKRPTSPEAPALAYRIEGGTVLEGGYLRESGHTGINVLFNEGSKVELTSGTRGQIRTIDRDGAHVAIERGRAAFHVIHKDNRRWLVDAGPFLVTVTGTVFTVSWDPMSEELDLRLRQGSVVVKGPVSPGEIVLRAGQRLVSNLAKVETVISEEGTEVAGIGPSAASSAPALPAPGVRPPPTVRNTSPLSTPTKHGYDHQWNRKLARGQWDVILEEVERIGVETTLVEASSEDLFALANAARFRHRLDLARAALLAERRRFPAAPRTVEATYVLGRVEEAQDTGTARAIAWYDEYLSHAPTGALAGEALGRKMTLTDKLDGPARAKPLAEEYLRRFPRGNYAASARELLAP